MTDSSFAAMTTIECSTERASLETGYAVNLVDLLCTPLAPVDAETRLRLQLDTPHIIWETHLQGSLDIKAGDKLVIDTVKYPIKTVESWTWLPTGDVRVRLIIEDTRN